MSRLVTDHLSDDRLTAADWTPEEAKHVADCAQCRVAVRQLEAFLAGLPSASMWGPGGSETPPVPTGIPEADAGPRFSVLRPLGAGGMSLVMLAHDSVLGRNIAWKVLRPGLDRELSERFHREACITAQLEHPNIVPIYDLTVQADGSSKLFMREVRGVSLGVAIRSGQLPSIRERLDVFVKVCDAIAFVHSKGVVHRDLKPDNVMVGEFGEVQVMDFGLAAKMSEAPAAPVTASEADDAGLTQLGSVMGTLRYMSPEQARGETERVGFASDIYMLGATLWELLAGEPPFEGDKASVLEQVKAGKVPSPRQRAPSIPRDLEAVVLRAMAADPVDRYPTVLALRDDLVAFLADHPVSARAPTLPERGWKWFARNRLVVMPVAATGLLAVVVLMGLLAAWAKDANEMRVRAEQDAALAEEMASAAEFAMFQAKIATAKSCLTQAHRDLWTHPSLARSALLEARNVGSPSQWLTANLALDTLAGSTPVPVVSLATAGEIHRVAVSRRGDRVLTVTTDGDERRFVLPTGEDERWQGFYEFIEADPLKVAWAPDDLVVVHVPAPGGDEVELRRPGDGAVVARLGLDNPWPSMAWSPAQRLLLVPYRDGVAVVPVAPSSAWRAGDGRPGAVVIAISPDGTLLATGSGGSVELLSRATRRELAQVSLGRSAQVRALHFLDGRRLAIGTQSGIALRDLAGGSLRSIPTGAPVQAFAATPSGLLASLGDGSLLAVDDDGTTEVMPIELDGIVGVYLDGDLLLIHNNGADAGVHVFRWPSLEPLWTHPADVVVGGVDLRSGAVALATEADEVLVLDLQSGQFRWSAPVGRGALSGVALSEDGIVFATSSDHEISAVWRSERLWSWSLGEATGTALAAHDGLVAAALDDGTLWWLERGLFDKLSADAPAAVGRRYLAAHLPDLAAQALAPLSPEHLSRTERVLLVEEGLADPASLLTLDLAPGSAEAWAALATPGRQPGAGPR
jgi:hypothetical protein